MIAIAKNRLLGLLRLKNRSRATRVIRQTGNAYCLDAVIQMLCAHYQLPIPAGSEIRRLAGTTSNGASMIGAVNCLEKIGFYANAGQCNFKQLGALTAPAIALVTNNDGSLHYVIVNRARFGRVETLNPASGIKTKHNRSQFEDIWTGTLLLISPKTNDAIHLTTESSPVRFLTNLLLRSRGSVFLAAVAGLYQVALVVVGLLLLRDFIRSINDGASKAELFGILAGFLLCAIFKIMFNDCYDRIKNGLQKQIALGLELQATEHVQRMTVESLRRSDSLELAQRSRADALKLGRLTVAVTETLVQALVAGLLLATIGILDQTGHVWPVAFGISFLFPLFSFLPNRKSARLERHADEANDLVRKTLADTISGARPLRRCGATNQRVDEIRRLQLEAFRKTEKLQQHQTRSQTAGSLLGGIVASVVLFVSWQSTPRDPGLIVSYFVLINMISIALRKFSFHIARTPDLIHTIRRYLDLMSEQQERAAFVASNDTVLDCNHLRFVDVRIPATRFDSFGLNNFSLELTKGESALIIDELGQSSGAIAKLLTGQADAEEGRVLLDSINIRDLEKARVRQLIGFTSHDPHIFQTSLCKNIWLDSRPVSMEQLNDVATQTGLQDMVDKLPKRFDTVIGRKGMFTTWDERYRVGLARMSMSDPRIVVLQLPKYTLPDSLSHTINHLIHTRWRRQIVLVLSPHPQPVIRCSKTHRFNRLGQFLRVE